ncbi:MAG: VWA domain-containing protein [Chloroflexi bacterium]|nr:VWA domain-containing protein [Chloroflexota bacterium]MBP8055927.1 VWA domain-containing protein [Chloroflexota bacterium]
MHKQTSRGLVYLLTFLSLFAAACLCTGSNNVTNETDETTVEMPRNAAAITIVATTSLQPWLENAIAQFNNAQNPVGDEQTAFVTLNSVEPGQAIADMTGGAELPVLWLPDSAVWTSILADQGMNNYQSDCVSTAQSPLVIAMWREVAELFGWPNRSLGWLDVSGLAADPVAWEYYSGGQYGETLRLGHTHPGLSASGASTLLAIVQAAESQTEAISTDDIQQPSVQASVTAFESAVATFSPATAVLGQTMGERGTSYLSAAIVYESTVIQYGNSQIVPIYPFEGTFMADFPACLNSSASEVDQEVAELFRDYLLSEPAQQLALAAGLRPVNEAVTVGAPLDGVNGVDLSEPKVVFAAPTVETVYAVQSLWQAARKPVNLVMLLDVSGSMAGSKMEGMRAAALEFVEQMGENDYLTIIAFAQQPVLVARYEKVGEAREILLNTIRGLVADGDTTLYDAIGLGSQVITETTTPQTTNAMVVLSDGVDTYSFNYSFGDQLLGLAAANDTTVFVIAYGSDADESVLQQFAAAGNGNFYQGDVASIAAIYEEMSAVFGGTVGVGR